VIRHPLAWCVWGIAGLCAAFIDRNPLLQVLLVLVVINVGLPHRRNPAMRHWKIGLALAVVPILFSAALSRYGRHVIFPAGNPDRRWRLELGSGRLWRLDRRGAPPDRGRFCHAAGQRSQR